MKTYTIKKGRTDWSPKEPLQIFSNFKELVWEVSPDDSMIFDYNHDGKVDQDWNDWKKIGGISLADPLFCILNLFLKSRDSIQLGWRWNVDLQVFEFVVYVNRKSKFLPYGRPDQILRCDKNAQVVFKIIRESGRQYRALLYLKEGGPEDINEFVIEPRKRFTLYSRIGLWYGGSNNAQGPYGGRAPKEMKVGVGFTKK